MITGFTQRLRGKQNIDGILCQNGIRSALVLTCVSSDR